MYQQMIREDLARGGRIGVDPRHVEAYMRIERGSMDALSRRDFEALVIDCAEDVIAGGPEMAEELAKSEGL